jgi:hypothetical protein
MRIGKMSRKNVIPTEAVYSSSASSNWLSNPVNNLFMNMWPEGIKSTQISSDKNWLTMSPETLASVKRGIAQANDGQLKSLGSFEQYADSDIDE